jgi:hypothetical protein
MIEAVSKAMVMSAVEMQDAATFLPRYQPAQVEEAIEYTKEHASKPNWPYLKSVLKTKKRRLTFDDYASFSEMTKAKLDRFRGAVTGFEKVPPAHLSPQMRKAIYE